MSVVVPTYNRRHLLARTLDSLVRQHSGAVRYEVLVVDNNSSDDTPAVVARYTEKWPNFRYFLESRRGVSHARNTGAEAARADIVAFIDDDVEADPTWVATIKQTFDAHPEIDCVGGKIEARWAAPPPSWLTSDFWGPLALQAEKGSTPYVDAEHAARCLMTANFACRRAALFQVGGFSPAYLRDEDRELQLRLWAAGKRGMYDGSIVVSTDVPRDRLTKSYHRRFYWRAAAAHARMRFLDRIDRRGRLLATLPNAAALFGTPGFVYRYALRHLAGWAWCVVTLNWRRAFFHETRFMYFASYAWARCREAGPAWHAAPLDCIRFARALIANRFRARRPDSSTRGPLARV